MDPNLTNLSGVALGILAILTVILKELWTKLGTNSPDKKVSARCDEQFRLMRVDLDSVKVDIRSLVTDRAADRVKLDTLWEVYAMEAMRQANRTGLVEHHSPPQTTDKWLKTIPEDVRVGIMETAKRLSAAHSDSYDVGIEVWRLYKAQLLSMVKEDDEVSPTAVLGTVLVIAERAWEEVHKK